MQLVCADAKPRSRRLRLSVGSGVSGQQVQSPDRVDVEILLQLQSSFQDADGVARLLFQLQTPRLSAGKRNGIVHANELYIISDLCVRTPLTTPRIFSVISFSCCKTLNLREGTNQSLSHVTRTKNEHKISPDYTIAFYQKENLHVHLVRSRFVLFLWEAAQYNGSNGPLQKTERFHSKNSLYFYFSSTVSHKNSPLTIDCI